MYDIYNDDDTKYCSLLSNLRSLKRIIILLAISLSSLGLISCNKQSDETYLLTNENLNHTDIKWIGRTHYDQESKQVFLYHTATGFELNYIGTSIEVTAYASNAKKEDRRPYFQVSFLDDILNDGERIAITEEEQTIVLGENLKYGSHHISFIKLSEAYDGLTAIKQIKINGKLMPLKESNPLRFQIIGGSGIHGHGALGINNEPRTTKNSSSLHAFGYLTARMFDGETQFIGNSGAGLLYGYRYGSLMDYYDYVGLLDDGRSRVDVLWDHQTWIPDIVIINLGGNDFNSYISGLIGEKLQQEIKNFQEAVVTFCQYIKSLYPNVYIIWTHTNSVNGQYANAAIQDAVLDYVKVVVIPKVGSDGDPVGANNHNSLNTHIRTADIISHALETWLGLNPIKSNITK